MKKFIALLLTFMGIFVSCSSNLEHKNPYDPESSYIFQKKVQLLAKLFWKEKMITPVST